jgi:hypothetical protein
LDGLVEGLATPAYSAAQGLLLYAQGDEVARGDSGRMSGGSRRKISSGKSGDGFLGKIGGLFKNILP